MSIRTVKSIITLGALVTVLARVIWPDLAIDGVTLGLLGLSVLPWLSPLVKSAELPGGFKIEFQDVQAAGEKITGGMTPRPPGQVLPTPSYLEVSDIDPNLALVGLRIELEKRVRTLAERFDIGERYSLRRMVDGLQRHGALTHPAMSGLLELIEAGNHAAHGADVDSRAARWAMDYGPDVLAFLDEKIG